MLGEERAGTAALTVHLAAPAGVVYAVLADAATMPLYFLPCVHVERLHFDGEHERARMWALMDGQLTSWTSWRHLDPVARRIEFSQQRPNSAPGAAPASGDAVSGSLCGVLSVRERGTHTTELQLRYGARTPGAPPPPCWQSWISHLGSRGQLAGLKNFAEQWTRLDDLVLSFEDSVRINGPAELAYDFLYRAGDWPDLVPHVTGAHLTEDAPGVQRLALQTLTDTGRRSTSSVRICFPHAGRIVYKQTACWDLLASHTGEWSVVPDATGVTVTSRQSVVLREEHYGSGPGAERALASARRQVRTVLGQNCLALLALAKQHAETAVRML
ncbi:SRPBCC family protein [Streptomyces sp. NPDC006997]|uniref:SRPBCC family protein n=1 Tax=Streptomyces sp. NPDC006997 TaxID=3155356 RepID=UPI0033CE3CF9